VGSVFRATSTVMAWETVGIKLTSLADAQVTLTLRKYVIDRSRTMVKLVIFSSV